MVNFEIQMLIMAASHTSKKNSSWECFLFLPLIPTLILHTDYYYYSTSLWSRLFYFTQVSPVASSLLRFYCTWEIETEIIWKAEAEFHLWYGDSNSISILLPWFPRASRCNLPGAEDAQLQYDVQVLTAHPWATCLLHSPSGLTMCPKQSCNIAR